MTRKLIAALMLLLSFGVSKAQQDHLFTQYMFSPLAYNPGYAGSLDVMNITAASRFQWLGIKGSPMTQMISWHTPLSVARMAVGASLFNDKAGPLWRSGFDVDFAYRPRINHRGRLCMGLKASMSVLNANLVDLDIIHPEDPQFAQNIYTKLMPNVGAGIYYYEKNFFVGLGVPRILSNKYFSTSLGLDTKARERQHYYFTAGGVFDLHRDWKLKPTTMVRAVVNAPLSVDAAATIIYREMIWGGLMYRLGDAVGMMVQYQLNDQIRVGYAYDYTLSRLNNHTRVNTHEIMLSYMFKYNRGKIISPRYF